MKRILLVSILAILTVVAIGCAASRAVSDAVQPAAMPAPTAAAPLPAMDQSTSNSEAYGSAGGKAAGQPPAPGATNNQSLPDQRMIVYTGNLSLQVNDTAETVNKITDMLKTVNGYVASRSLSAYGKDKLQGTIVIRVPAAALDTTIAQIKALGVKVLKEDANSNDVTEEYVDLDARRKNLEAYEVELQKLLDTVRERTGKAEDILAVYNQLTEVRGQIEQIQGRQKYLENTSTLATYTIQLVPVEEVIVEGKPGWNPGQTVSAALDRLVGTLQGLADLAIILTINVLPVLLIFAIPVVILVLILRAVIKRRSVKKPAAAA